MKRKWNQKTSMHEKNILQNASSLKKLATLQNTSHYSGSKVLLKVCLLTLFFGISTVYSQNYPVYTIPSYNVTVEGFADFMKTLSVQKKNGEKAERKVIVHLKSANNPLQSCEATVWIYSLDLVTVLGPFQLGCGDEISVDIDDRDWGVMVDSSDKIVVDVWFEEGLKKIKSLSSK